MGKWAKFEGKKITKCGGMNVCVCLIEIRTNWRRIMETRMEEGDDKTSNERREGRGRDLRHF